MRCVHHLVTNLLCDTTSALVATALSAPKIKLNKANMFQKRIIEVFTFILYWMVITPTIYKYCELKEWIKWDNNTIFESTTTYVKYMLIFIAGYVVFYHMILIIYMKLTVCDVKMWHNLRKTQKDPEAMLHKNTYYKAVSLEEMDTVDGKIKSLPIKPQMIRTISHPLLVEKDLAAIHIKHETRPLQNATLPRVHQIKASPTPSLRCAPPVPCTLPRTPGTPHQLKNGVIISPNVLLHT